MARFGVLLAALAGALLAVTARAAPAAVNDINAIPELCNPTVCMGLAVLHSDCTDGFNPGPVIQNGVPVITALTNCVCADSKLKENYLNCYGFCDLDPAKDPFCASPVNARTADADVTAPEDPTITAPAALKIAEREAVKIYGTLRNWLGFCGVPGQACGKKMIATATATAETALPEITAPVADVQAPEVTAALELEHADIAEREPKKIYGTLRNWLGFCGVPGQACGEKMIATATEAAETTLPETTAPVAELTAAPEITAVPELEHADIAEREPKKIYGTLRNWLGFCGVPGQACAEKVVTPTAGAEGAAPTTLQTVKTPFILPTDN